MGILCYQLNCSLPETKNKHNFLSFIHCSSPTQATRLSTKTLKFKNETTIKEFKTNLCLHIY